MGQEYKGSEGLNRFFSYIKKHMDILPYLFFGVLTTIVSFAIYFSLYHYAHMSATWSNVIAWAGAVLVAFVTNKPFVFHSHDWSASVLFPELGKFVGSRLFSGLLETALLALTVDLLHFHNLAMKIIAGTIVFFINYAASKLIVFRKRPNG